MRPVAIELKTRDDREGKTLVEVKVIMPSNQISRTLTFEGDQDEFWKDPVEKLHEILKSCLI